MNLKWIPGTVVPWGELTGGAFSLLRPMLKAAGGFTLSQVCTVTGLELSTVQNWVKRRFVMQPVKKKYGERQLARILLLNTLRDCLQLDHIVALLTLLNGDLEREDDDTVAESELFDALCRALHDLDPAEGLTYTQALARAEAATADYGGSMSSHRLIDEALAVMIMAYAATWYRSEADLHFRRLTGAASAERSEEHGMV